MKPTYARVNGLCAWYIWSFALRDILEGEGCRPFLTEESCWQAIRKIESKYARFAERLSDMESSCKPAMKITDQKEADKYFEMLVQESMQESGKSREEIEKMQRSNLAYFAGYYDDATRLRVERLFCCAHPIFGKASEHIPTPEEAFE